MIERTFALALSLALVGCLSTESFFDDRACEPGRQTQCACAGGERSGVQVCADDGARWQACTGCDVVVSSASSSTSSTSGGGGAGSSSSSSTSSGEGGAVSGASSSTSSSTSSSGSSSSSSSSTSGCLDHLVISEVRTRGVNGANDEFVEVYNPTGAVWSGPLKLTTEAGFIFGSPNVTIAPGQRWVVGGPDYQGPSDATMGGGFMDTGFVVLYQNATPDTGWIDAVCYCALDNMGCNPGPGVPYCVGHPPADNWHDNLDVSNTWYSLTRTDVCTDIGNSTIEFKATPPTPGQ